MPAGNDTLHRHAAALTLSQSEAILAVLASAVAVDGMLGTEEVRTLEQVLATARWSLGLTEQAVAAAAQQGREVIAKHGLPAVLSASADAIPRDLHPTIFALAVDLALADGRLGSQEATFIDHLQAALHIDGRLARKILDVLVIKNRASGRPDI